MKNKHTIYSIILMNCFVLLSFSQPTQDEINKLRNQARPGPEHQLLKKLSGNWDLTIQLGPEENKKFNEGTARSYMTLENRFLWIGYEVQQSNNRKLKGSYTIGFDRRHDHFTLIAMDTYGTYFITSSGKMIEGENKAKLYGKDDDPYMKSLGFSKEFAHVIDFGDKDSFTIDVFFIDTRTEDRNQELAMKFKFKRRQK